MPLTASFVRDAKGRDKAYKVSDGGGLYMFVQPSGQRYWRLAYRWAGNQRTLALGVYPAVGLMDARKRRDAVRKLLAQGTDPLALAREKAAAARLAEMATFKAVAEEFVAKCELEGCAEVTIIKQRWMLRFAYPNEEPAPLRLVLGSDAYALTKRAYAARSAGLEAQRERASSTDVIEKEAGVPWYATDQR